MKIEVQEFEAGNGVRFLISSQNAAEQTLLMACVSKKVLVETGDEHMFYLILPVSNN